MKVTENDITIYRIELEEGDKIYDLYETLGEFTSDGPISIVKGGIEVREF